jgi:hypothetical protein
MSCESCYGGKGYCTCVSVTLIPACGGDIDVPKSLQPQPKQCSMCFRPSVAIMLLFDSDTNESKEIEVCAGCRIHVRVMMQHPDQMDRLLRDLT